MKEIELTAKNKIVVLQETIDVLERGGVVIYPTETSYGLGGDFFNHQVFDKIYQIKERDKDKPLPVIVPDIMTATTLVEFSKEALRLSGLHWPGPLTLVLPYRYYDLGDSYDGYLALRISSYPFVSGLLAHFGKPLIATSANISGEINCYTARDVRRRFLSLKKQPDLFINAGNLPIRKPSTIIKIDKNNQIKILRQGDLKI